MHVAITGTLAAGKGEIAKILRRRGFEHYGFGDYIRDELRKQEKDISVENMRELANSLRAQHGPDFLAKLLLRRYEHMSPRNAVFESVRTLGELQTLRTLPGLVLLAVDAPREIRYERQLTRTGRRDGLNTFEAFCAAEDAQLEGATHEQNILAVMDQADIKIVNIGNLEELEAQVRDALGI